MYEWKPIEELPDEFKDGRNVLFKSDFENKVALAYYHEIDFVQEPWRNRDDVGIWFQQGSGRALSYVFDFGPTHFMDIGKFIDY